MRICVKALPLVVILLSAAAAGVPAEASPCVGLLCDLTPNSMAKPVDASEAARVIAERKTADVGPKTDPASARHRHHARRQIAASPPLALVLVVAGKKVSSLKDLSGKVVSFGSSGDARQAIARKTFDKLGIQVAETPLDPTNALDGIASGDVQAAVLVGNHDLAVLRGLSPRDLHILAIPSDAKPPIGMKRAKIDARTLPDFARGGPIATFALDAKSLQHFGRPQLASSRGVVE